MLGNINSFLGNVGRKIISILFPNLIPGTTFWTKVEILPRDQWNQEGFQLNNEIDREVITSYPDFPKSSNGTVTLNSTTTVDATVGFRLDFKILARSFPTFGIAGDAFLGFAINDANSFHIFSGLGGFGTGFISCNISAAALVVNKRYSFSVRCDGVSIIIYVDDVLISTTPIGTGSTIDISILGSSRGRLADGQLYDVFINNIDATTNWTSHYLGINEDWTDQIGINDGTAGVGITYVDVTSTENSILNLQLKTGSALNFVGATLDLVNFPTYVGIGDYTFTGKCFYKASTCLLIGGNSGSDYAIWLAHTFFASRPNASTVSTPPSNFSDVALNQWVDVAISREGNQFNYYINGVLKGQNTGNAGNITVNHIGRQVATGGQANSASYNYAFFPFALTQAEIQDLQFDPQLFLSKARNYGADRIYMLNEGRFLNNDPAYDLSGNHQHGTFLTGGAVGYDASVNGLDFNFQNSLHSRSIIEGQRVLSETAIGDTDILANAISQPWKAGRINLLGGIHGGSTAINLGTNKNVAFAMFLVDASINQTIFELGAVADDITISGSAIVCADFDTITVNKGANALVSGAWNYVELTKSTGVLLDAFRIKEGLDAIIIPAITSADELTESQSTGQYDFVQTLY